MDIIMNQNQVFLITYPDSLGGNLHSLKETMEKDFQGSFSGVHILPPFPSTGDRGFAPVDYTRIEPLFGTYDDIKSIAQNNRLMVDIMVNHVSRRSKYFLDYAQKGEDSPYRDMFLPLTDFWPEGVPDEKDLSKIFLRREAPYSPYLIKGKSVNLWTTFGKTTPSEQVDINVNSDSAQRMFEDTFACFAKNGVSHVRLDAVGYVTKVPGTSCFFVEPEIYEFLGKITKLAQKYHLELLPEVHGHYSLNRKLLAKEINIYDFILPYEVLQAILLKDGTELAGYLKTCPYNQFTTLDCHDGIPVKPDLDDIAKPENIRKVCDLCESRGSNFSYVLSESHCADGIKVHQIRGTFFECLGRNEADYLAARAIQLFAPGVPQVYYVGLLAGLNDTAKAQETGDGRELNRHNYTGGEIHAAVQKDIVQKLLSLVRLRREHPAFAGEMRVEDSSPRELRLTWQNGEYFARLAVDFEKSTSEVTAGKGEEISFVMSAQDKKISD